MSQTAHYMFVFDCTSKKVIVQIKLFSPSEILYECLKNKTYVKSCLPEISFTLTNDFQIVRSNKQKFPEYNFHIDHFSIKSIRVDLYELIVLTWLLEWHKSLSQSQSLTVSHLRCDWPLAAQRYLQLTNHLVGDQCVMLVSIGFCRSIYLLRRWSY